MSEEEKKAIDYLENLHPIIWWESPDRQRKLKRDKPLSDAIDIALNLIETHQKETEKKDKIINIMAKMINNHDIDEDICSQFGKSKNCKDYTNEELCVQCIIDYFTKKVEEKNDK